MTINHMIADKKKIYHMINPKKKYTQPYTSIISIPIRLSAFTGVSFMSEFFYFGIIYLNNIRHMAYYFLLTMIYLTTNS